MYCEAIESPITNHQS